MKRGLRICLLVLMFLVAQAPIMVSATETQAQTEASSQAESTSTRTTEDEDDQNFSAYNDQKTFGISDEFDGLTGNSKYVGSKYRQNYYLDLEKTGITEVLEAGINMLANVVFGIYQFFATVTCSIVYFCLDFSFAELIAGFISGLQANLINGVFKQLWYLGVAAMGFSLIGNMFKREFAEIFKNLAMVVGVTIVSILLVSHTSTILTASTNITKSASTAIFVGLDTATGMSEDGEYAVVAAGSLWSDMIHGPWLTMEFGSLDVDSEVVDEILSLPKGSSDRKEIVKDLNKDTDCFDKSRGVDRLSMLICYAVPFLMKMVVFVMIALLQVIGQVLAVFIMLLAFIVLVLAMIPHYGTSIIAKWLEKFMDIHLSMLVLSFLMALLIWINKLAYTLAGTIGWFIAMALQAAICVVLFMNYKTILFMLMHPRDGMSDINRMLHRMNRQSPGGQQGSYGYDDYPDRRRRQEECEDNDEYESDREYDGDRRNPYNGQQNDAMDEDTYRESRGSQYPASNRRGTDTIGYRESYPGDRGASGETVSTDATEERSNLNGPQEFSRNSEERYVEMMQGPDYEAMRSAPSRQELYDMFEGTENEEAEAEDDSGDVLAVGENQVDSDRARTDVIKDDGMKQQGADAEIRAEEMIQFDEKSMERSIGLENPTEMNVGSQVISTGEIRLEQGTVRKSGNVKEGELVILSQDEEQNEMDRVSVGSATEDENIVGIEPKDMSAPELENTTG